MQHVLDVNRQTALEFVKKSQQFLNLPHSLFQCDIDKCNPKLYAGMKGRAAIRRSKKAIALTKRINRDIEKLKKILS